MTLLDEVMVSVIADEIAPLLAGIAYCQLIALCQAVFDLRRAREWTEALRRWCNAQPDLVPFRANCLVHRREIFQLQAWTEALESARQARMLLSGPPVWDALGSAHLPARRDPAVARRARGGGAVLPPGPPRWTRPRAGNVVAALGAGAYRPCSARDPTSARRSAGSDRSITPAAGALVRRIRSVAFPGLRDEYPSATAPATLATSRRCRGWRRSAQPE